MRSELIQSDCIEALRAMKPESADSIVTDPPYGLSPDGKARTWDEVGEGRARGGFMGKDWDSAVPGLTWARACLDVLKPGGWIAAFSSTRTQHRLTCALEDAGFQIRDVIAVAQFQGFPKSQDASKAIDAHFGAEREVVGVHSSPLPGGITYAQDAYSLDHRGEGRELHPITAPATPEAKRFNGYGTALKPAYEPCILARKPMIGTLAENLLAHGTGAINIDGCRFAYGDPAWLGPNRSAEQIEKTCAPNARGLAQKESGRCRGDFGNVVVNVHPDGRWPANLYHAAKPSRGEREAGCEALPALSGAETVERTEGSAGLQNPRAGAGRTADSVHNVHPTVKPVQAMRWIVRLLTPPGGLCIDPFLGSGTTGIAAALEQRDFIGIEREADYIRIARARIDHWGRQQQFDFGRAAE